jgi:lipopolysaccharide export system permease protein
MKILDRYVAKNFLIGYAIALAVLVGLRVSIDLFVHLDEFAELSDDHGMSAFEVLINVFAFYGAQCTLYFRDFAGMITVVAAVFSLGKMTRNNELIAVMASGVSLKRVIMPIVLLAVILTGLLIFDQEVLIPRLANRLVRSHDAKPGDELYELWFMGDNNNSLVCTKKFEEKTSTMFFPTIIKRRKNDAGNWVVTGKISADSATYNDEEKRWYLENAYETKITRSSDASDFDQQVPTKVEYYDSDLTPRDIPIRKQEGYKSLLSSHQLAVLAKSGSGIKDQAELHSQKHFRFTDPIINIVMLLIALPVLVCRDPKNMKSAIIISFTVTTACFIVTFGCKMFAGETFFNQIRPALWAWLPIVIFMPIAFVEIDSMKT